MCHFCGHESCNLLLQQELCCWHAVAVPSAIPPPTGKFQGTLSHCVTHDPMNTQISPADVERVRALLFSPSNRINSQLLEWGHRICSNPCISPDMCLDWPALAIQLQVSCSWALSSFASPPPPNSPSRQAGTLLLTHLFPFFSLPAASGTSLKTSLVIVAGC
jgi:hypothetical protein